MSEDQITAWIEALSADLGVDADVVDVQLLLDVARDAAHSVTRPAAPLATFMAGFAAAQRGATPEAVAEVCDLIAERARVWREEMPG